jgi:hypothetical protein
MKLGFYKFNLNKLCRKYKESAHMACVTSPISQPTLEISSIWIPLTSKDVSKLRSSSVWPGSLFLGHFVKFPSLLHYIDQLAVFYNWKLCHLCIENSLWTITFSHFWMCSICLLDAVLTKRGLFLCGFCCSVIGIFVLFPVDDIVMNRKVFCIHFLDFLLKLFVEL